MSDLNAVANPELTVTLRGTVYPIDPVDGFGMSLIKSVPTNDRAGMIHAMYKVAFKCLKGAFTWEQVYGSEDVNGLSEHEVMDVVESAGKQVKQVEATLPNDGKAAAVKGEESQTPPLSPPSPQLMKQAS